MSGAPRTSRPAHGRSDRRRASSSLLRVALVAVLMLAVGYGLGLLLGQKLL